jgi:hypothetical protein
MWKSWFIDNDLTWLGLPAMVIFMVAFVVASVRAFRTPPQELSAAAALPLADDMPKPHSPPPSSSFKPIAES